MPATKMKDLVRNHHTSPTNTLKFLGDERDDDEKHGFEDFALGA